MRLRHTFHICFDLGLPTGGLAMVAGAVDEQNSRMIWSLLAAQQRHVAQQREFQRTAAVAQRGHDSSHVEHAARITFGSLRPAGRGFR